MKYNAEQREFIRRRIATYADKMVLRPAELTDIQRMLSVQDKIGLSLTQIYSYMREMGIKTRKMARKGE